MTRTSKPASKLVHESDAKKKTRKISTLDVAGEEICLQTDTQSQTHTYRKKKKIT
jgi:hypothetical protein